MSGLLGRVSLAAHSLESMLFQPIGNGRPVAPNEAADLLQGEPLSQAILQKILLHEEKDEARVGRKNERAFASARDLLGVGDALHEHGPFAAQLGSALPFALLAGGADQVLEAALLELEEVEFHRLL